MAITTLDGYVASNRQILTFSRSATIIGTAAVRSSMYHLAGNPGAGTLAGTSTTAGVLVTSSTAGFPTIKDTGAANYYLSRVAFTNSVISNVIVQDLLYKAGAYSFNSNVTLSAQPSIAGRVPGGAYGGIDMYFECVTAFTGIPTVTVTYTNQDGVAGRTTGAFSLGVAPVVGKLVKLPLQAGDSGVQKVESVVATVATVGTFNIQLVRDIWIGRLPITNGSVLDGFDKTGLTEIYQTSALNFLPQADGTSSGLIGGFVEIASG
jgi:hypothetical protein